MHSSIFQRERQASLTFLETLVNQDSGSYYKEGCDKIIAFMKQKYEELDFDVTILPEPETGNHLYIKHSEAVNPSILIVAHLDTVFHEVGTTTERPFTIDDNQIARGPGVFDMKASQVMVYFALKSLMEEKSEAYKHVHLILNTDEEIGSVSSRKHIEHYAKQSKAVLIAEPSGGDYLTVARKGGGKYQLSIEGKASHAGGAPEKGISAIEELAQKTIQLHKMNDWEGVNVNVGLISGGTSPNTIAPNAEAHIDLRFETPEQGKQADEKIREILSYSDVEGTTLELTGGITRPAWKTDQKSMDLFELIKEEAESLGMSLDHVYSGGGSDGNFTGNLGIPTVDSLGPIGGNAHQPDEYLHFDTLETKGELFISVLKKLSDPNHSF